MQAIYDCSQYKCHYFRIGASATAATRGFTDAQIQTMGRWRSAAFRRYIRIPTLVVFISYVTVVLASVYFVTH